jgi:hypothetical protein
MGVELTSTRRARRRLPTERACGCQEVPFVLRYSIWRAWDSNRLEVLSHLRLEMGHGLVFKYSLSFQ